MDEKPDFWVVTMDLPKRKQIRLKEYDYSTDGAYFVTVCTKDKKHILSKIGVGGGIPDAPYIELTKKGEIVREQFEIMNHLYENINVNHYVIMPNHIHFIIEISNGRSGTPAPTRANAIVPKYISTFKRFTNKKCGIELWQRSYYDHIIRNESDLIEKQTYILSNPYKWVEDEYYSQ